MKEKITYSNITNFKGPLASHIINRVYSTYPLQVQVHLLSIIRSRKIDLDLGFQYTTNSDEDKKNDCKEEINVHMGQLIFNGSTFFLHCLLKNLTISKIRSLSSLLPPPKNIFVLNHLCSLLRRIYLLRLLHLPCPLCLHHF